MKCSKCGTENPESAKFCNECGGELKEGEENQSIKKCPNCGFYVGDKNKCDSCGYSIKTGNEPKTNSLIDIVKNNIDKIIMISSICLLIVVLTIIIAVSVSDNNAEQKLAASQSVSTATPKPVPTAKPTPAPTVDPVAAQKAAEEKAAKEKAAKEKAEAEAAAAKEYSFGITANEFVANFNSNIIELDSTIKASIKGNSSGSAIDVITNSGNVTFTLYLKQNYVGTLSMKGKGNGTSHSAIEQIYSFVAAVKAIDPSLSTSKVSNFLTELISEAPNNGENYTKIFNGLTYTVSAYPGDTLIMIKK